ncbi:MAG: O-methyltransferase [Chitinophagaceae bacterium]
MYSRWQLVVKYLGYFFSSASGKGHGIHSPFIFQFVSRVLQDKKKYPEYERVELIKDQMLNDEKVLTIEDLGAGSFANNKKQRTVSSLARSAARSKKTGRLLFRIVRTYQPKTIVELGTSLGISTAYLSLANPGSMINTIEGAKETAAIARNNFEKLYLQNIKVIQGNFDDTLLPVISPLSEIDFAFIDGNHRREPTERYFLQLLQKINNDSIFVFDDIHWSPEMEQAWETIKNNDRVRCTVDLFSMGIVFFRHEFREKQHFVIRF